MIIEHDEHGRVMDDDMIEDLSGNAYIIQKDGFDEVRYKKDGWREVKEKQWVSVVECDTYVDAGTLQIFYPNGKHGEYMLLHLPTGFQWRKVEAYVLPETIESWTQLALMRSPAEIMEHVSQFKVTLLDIVKEA